MKKIIFYILLLSNLFSQNSSSSISEWHDGILDLLRNGKSRELLKNIRNYLKSEELTNKEEVYLKMWEIKGLFYEGKIDSSKMKFEDFKNKIDSKKYSALKELPYYDYIENKNKNKKCMVNTLGEDILKIWNLEILNPEQFKKHFIDLELLVGKNIEDYNVIPDEHDQKILIKDLSGNKVKFSIFPPLIQLDESKLKEYEDDVILDYEFNLAKKNRIKILQKQIRQPIRFSYYNDKLKKFTCKLDNLPIIKGQKKGSLDQIHDFYKLYIHDSKKTERYSFRLNQKSSNLNDNMILINWDENNWVMHEDFDENKIEITVPDFYKESVKFSIEGRNLKNLQELNEMQEFSNKEGILVHEKGSENPSDFDKWEINQNNFNFVDMGVIETKSGIDSLGVDRIDVFADSTLTTLNIEITNNYPTYEADKKKLDRMNVIFYSTLLITILSLIFI